MGAKPVTYYDAFTYFEAGLNSLLVALENPGIGINIDTTQHAKLREMFVTARAITRELDGLDSDSEASILIWNAKQGTDK